METIWLAQIPECFGYGICILDTTENGALVKLRKEYKKMAAGYNCQKSFNDAMDYFGGSVSEIEIGKSYNDGFKN